MGARRMACKVRGCRFPGTHVTRGHRCGSCFQFGHGIMECADLTRVDALHVYWTENMPTELHCTVLGCMSPTSHSVEGHHCGQCGKRGATVCCSSRVTRTCPLCKTVSEIHLADTFFTGVACVVCMDHKPLCLFPNCRHVTVCVECTQRMGQ